MTDFKAMTRTGSMFPCQVFNQLLRCSRDLIRSRKTFWVIGTEVQQEHDIIGVGFLLLFCCATEYHTCSARVKASGS